ncbi:MAG TPA: hypothetical protein VN915_10320 [Elusimicrobiota bacterium]|nr:hypothetical protein [Elusimicrobiota bacterium]
MFLILAIVLSMTAGIPLVNASAEDLPIGNHSVKGPQDSVKRSSNDLSNLLGILMKTGDDDIVGETTTELGLASDLPTKGRDFTITGPKGEERREFSIVFAGSSDKTPRCLYIEHRVAAGHGADATYYRMSLSGKLEHVTVCHIEYGADGKVIPGSAIDAEKNVDAPEVQKAFKREFTYWTKDWVKAEKKAQARTVAAPAATPAP